MRTLVVSKSSGRQLNLPTQLANKLLKANKVNSIDENEAKPKAVRGRKKKE